MRRLSDPLRCHLLNFGLLALAFSGVCRAAEVIPGNDHIFPPGRVAKTFIDFDRHGFLLHGKRTFLVSGGMEYARVPRELWADRLLRLKRGGFNTVEIYTFWNFHEPVEGQFNFSGDHDLDAFLKLVRRTGMYAIVRVGPYSCAEWVQGGFPLWLRFKEDVRVREPNAAFERALDPYLDRLFRIVAVNQIHRGGSVILVQLENEHPAGWGTAMPNSYFRYLRRKAVSRGVEVPQFFSGLHHASDPAGDVSSLDDAKRPNPWFSTEFWSVWYSQYGSKPKDAEEYSRRTWKIIAHGGNGFNIYMAHGGTNFGFTNDNEDAASYDYGAAVGQGGDLRPIYYAFKRAAWFARSFADVLENSSDDRAFTGITSSNPKVRMTARTGAAGTIVFLDNATGSLQQTEIHKAGAGAFTATFQLAPGEILPVPLHVRLDGGAVLEHSSARVVGAVRSGNITTVLVHGPNGSTANVVLNASFVAVAAHLPGKAPSTKRWNAHLRFDSADPTMQSRSIGGKTVRILALADDLVDRTWIVSDAGKPYLLVGASFVRDAAMRARHLEVTEELPWIDTINETRQPIFAFDSKGGRMRLARPAARSKPETSISLSTWGEVPLAVPVTPDFDDSAWLLSDEPPQMGSDGDPAPEAWYRSTVRVSAPGTQVLHFDNGGDREQFFVDGKRVGSVASHHPGFLLSLNPGFHKVAVYVAHDGRDKLWNYLGALGSKDPKGLSGPAHLWEGVEVSPLTWRAHTIKSGENATAPPPSSGDWQVLLPDRSRVAHTIWFQTTLPSVAAGRYALEFTGSDQEISVYVNGRLSPQQPQWGADFKIDLDGAAGTGQPVVVTLRVQNKDGAPTVDPSAQLIRFTHSTPVEHWRMRGVSDQLTFGSRTPPTSTLNPAATNGTPRLFQTSFSVAPDISNETVWRIVPEGLSHGSVWVNGHNLGRYPEKISVLGLYLPSCWLKSINTILVYDEDGLAPSSLQIHAERLASRAIVRASSEP